MPRTHLQKRKSLMKRFGNLYRRVTGFNLEKCAYCDGPRQCLDHVPALAVVENLDLKLFFKSGGKLLLYPACQECNRLLNSFSGIDYYERLDYLALKYNKKLNTVEYWSDKEINEMGRNLRDFIRGHQYTVRDIIKKLYVVENRRLGVEVDTY